MPAMSKPKGQVPALQGLYEIGSAMGLADPQAIMGVGGALPLAGAAKVAPAASRVALRGLQRAMPKVQELGELMPDFTPMGGEAVFNAGRRPAAEGLKDAAVTAYLKILGQGGR